jgi:hypothetical protein
MSDMILPRSFTKVTRSTVVVPAPDEVGVLFDPTTGRTVVPARVEMSLRWDCGTDRGDRVFAYVAVVGPRRLKSGADGREIYATGWEDEVVEGRYGYRYRPQWLTDLIAEHLPAVQDLGVAR